MKKEGFNVMKVMILTEGGKDIGFGHITRCIALYQAFEEKGIIPEIIAYGDDSIIDLLEDKNFKIFDWISKRKELLKLADSSDVIIMDSYLCDVSLFEDMSNLAKVVVYMDDNKRVSYPSGIVVNGGILAEELDYPKKDGIRYLLGNRFAVSRKIFWNTTEKDIRENIENIMITFGGDDIRNMTTKILRFLIDSYPDITKKVIIGKGFKKQGIERIEGLQRHNIELVYYPDSEKMKDMMIRADIAISAGGQTLYELARIGVPTVVVAIAENQLNNIDGWRKTNFIEYAGWHGDEDLFANIDSILKRSDYKKREAISIAGQKVIDGQGSRRVVEEIIEKSSI